MDATAIIYQIKNKKGKAKTYLIRKVFGYKDFSNNGNYYYNRLGLLSSYVIQKWGKSVIIINRKDEKKVATTLNKNGIAFKMVRIRLD